MAIKRLRYCYDAVTNSFFSFTRPARTGRVSFSLVWPSAFLSILFWAAEVRAAENQFVAENDVAWTAFGKNENDSMPLGNGDLAANIWTEQNGDVVLLIAKADAWTETGKLAKLGRVRV